MQLQIFLILSIVVISCVVQAVKPGSKHVIMNQGPNVAKVPPPKSMKDRLSLPHKDYDLVVQQKIKTKSGKKKVRLQQTFKGIPVEGSLVVADENDMLTGALYANIVRNIEDDFPGDIAPELNKNKALMKCLDNRGHSCHANARSVDIRLVIFKDNEPGRTELPCRLVYSVTYLLKTETGETLPHCKVDAVSGDVIESFEGLYTGGYDVPYTTDLVGGNIKIGNKQYLATEISQHQDGNDCELSSHDIAVYDMKDPIPRSPHRYNCTDTLSDAINGGHSPLSDGMGTAKISYDMFVDYTNTSLSIKAGVHFGSSFENAYYNPADDMLIFGDGGSTYHPLVTLCVMAHELAHKFTFKRSNLEYRGQSGGIDEAFSDMACQAARFKAGQTPNFLVGDEADKSSSGFLRDMCDPPRDELSIDHAEKYQYDMDVHLSSGVFNLAFCNLAKLPGWDVKQAFILLAEAQTYWGTRETFNSAVCGIIQAAFDLSKSSQQVQEVAIVFSNVGAGCNS